MTCEYCASAMLPVPRKSKRHIQRYRCSCCEVYNAAVAAGQAAAESLTKQRFPGATYGRIWFNDHGFFAEVNGKHVDVGTAKESAPFWKLSTAAMNAARIDWRDVK